MAPKKKQAEEVESVAARFGRSKNTLKMGIVGLPNVGKSSLFNLLCDMEAAAENYPFCTIDPTESRCALPDERIDYLASIYKPQRVLPAYLNITDIAGLVKGAAEGAGLGNAFLSHIAAVDGIFHVVRAFEDDQVLHVEDCIDPVRDLQIITGELCQKDLEYLLKQEAAVTQANKNKKVKLPENYISCLETLKQLLEDSKPILMHEWTNSDITLIKEYYPNLLTVKPMIYLINCSVKQFVTGNIKTLDAITTWITEHGGGSIIPFSVKFEQGLFQHKENPEKIAEICKKAGKKSIIPEMIRSGYDQLNLINFFTCGPMEVRAWTVYKGSCAPAAAGVIHTDFEKCFIKAECVAFDDFKAVATKPSMDEVRAAGKFRQEGKQYVVQSGDILNIMHNAR